MRADWLIFAAAGCIVGLIVYGFIAWCLLAYRRGRHRTPARFTGNAPLELFLVALPIAMVAGLFFLTYRDEMTVDALAADPANRVVVTAFRWSWRFEYSQTGRTTFGTTMEPPTLYLPVSEITEVDLSSADVTHSFWVPAFLFKRDAIPGIINHFDIFPTKTGTYLGRCAQFCGLEHALMTFRVRVLPKTEYDRIVAAPGTSP